MSCNLNYKYHGSFFNFRGECGGTIGDSAKYKRSKGSIGNPYRASASGWPEEEKGKYKVIN